MSQTNSFAPFEARMRGAGMGDAPIRAFRHACEILVSGQTGLLPETAIEPVTELPRYEDISARSDAALLGRAVVVKLNGGLGTGMGLEKAKSLLEVKDGLTFLDFIARQTLWLGGRHDAAPRFLVMNSFSTSRDTREYLAKYPELGDPARLELMQSAVPKVEAATLQPISWPKNQELEWCPPGHGDLYPSLLASGWLDRLLGEGVQYLFVSNSDNLGASLDLALLGWFAESGKPFLMEVCERAPADRKGGHLARNHQGRFILRETAQCPEADQAAFQDVHRHRFFNTNNLWMRLDRLKQLLDENGGLVPLPVIQNSKTVDPRDKTSPKVVQLESAMGAAIECFADSGAIIVPRTRFAPVKTTSDLLALRSDAYRITEDWRVELTPGLAGNPPIIELDAEYYKLMNDFDARLRGGVPSLARCRELKVSGSVAFRAQNVFVGSVAVSNKERATKELPAGTYQDQAIVL